ncbi:unnamed protein product [Caenorhabditis brenneri]
MKIGHFFAIIILAFFVSSGVSEPIREKRGIGKTLKKWGHSLEKFGKKAIDRVILPVLGSGKVSVPFN